MISALTNQRVHDHPAAEVELIETHISWLLLAGNYAYKIKKPVTLPFVDYSSLDARRAYCEDELRLNHRLTSQVYLDVVAITGSAASPTIGGDSPPIEYAVRKRRFEQRALFDRDRADLGYRFLDGHLQASGDYEAGYPTIFDAAFLKH